VVDIHPEALLPVTALLLENGTMFHAKVIGLDRFFVPEDQARESGFRPASKN